MRKYLAPLAAGAAVLASGASVARAAEKPNIVLIYADDIGYGDLSCYGMTRQQTPNVDRLASAGLRFTDAHSASATCTPARYALMTGQYPWRRPGTGILPGDAALILDPARPTLPKMLQGAGYHTGVVGKWHLGLGGEGGPDWNGPITPGPREVGFDYAHFYPATNDRVPTVYVENDRVVGLDPQDPIRVSYKSPFPGEPTGKANPDQLSLRPSHGHADAIVDGVSRIGFQSGGVAARWKDEEMAPHFTQKAIEFLEQRPQGKPFFLFFPTHSIHVPRLPSKRARGKSPMGSRGDVLDDFDWSVGQLLDALDRLKLSQDTLVILTSDNGPVIDDGYQDRAAELLGGHKPAGPLRGTKTTVYEGGTRMPFVARWPGRIQPGTSDAVVCQVDLMASLAALTGQALEPGSAPDSHDVLPALLGQSQAGRSELVTQGSGPNLALRLGSWKYIGASPNRAQPELYDLAADLGEQKNVAAQHPERLAQMKARLETLRAPTAP